MSNLKHRPGIHHLGQFDEIGPLETDYVHLAGGWEGTNNHLTTSLMDKFGNLTCLSALIFGIHIGDVGDNTPGADAFNSFEISKGETAITLTPHITAIGYQTGDNITSSGIDNVCVGISAGHILTTGTRNVVIGYNAVVNPTTDYAVCIGPMTLGLGNSTVAVGNTSHSYGLDAVAVGSNTTASGATSVAVGHGALASGATTIAIGNDAEASGVETIVMGHGASASGDYSMSFGITSVASHPSSIAIGHTALSNDDNSLAIGLSANASAGDTMALGTGSTASRTNAIAIGHSAVASGDYSMSFGITSAASGNSSICIGYTGASTHLRSTALGYGASAGGDNSVSIGVNAITSAAGSYALGLNSAATDLDAMALGSACHAFSVGAVSIGNGASVSIGTNAIAIGTGAATTHNTAIAIGNVAATSNSSGIAIGTGAISTGTSGIAIGTDAYSVGDSNISIGHLAGKYQGVTVLNCFIGNGAGRGLIGSPQTGDSNVAVGHEALTGIITTAAANTAIGVRAGNSSTTGINNTFIGCDCDCTAGLSHVTCLGAGSIATHSNVVMLGSGNDNIVDAGPHVFHMLRNVPGSGNVNVTTAIWLDGMVEVHATAGNDRMTFNASELIGALYTTGVAYRMMQLLIYNEGTLVMNFVAGTDCVLIGTVSVATNKVVMVYGFITAASTMVLYSPN